MNLKLITMAISMALLSGIAASEVPQWVQPGVSATYHFISGGWANGAPVPNNAAEIYLTHQVNQVTREETTGTVSLYNPLTGQTQTQEVNCQDGAPACLGRFWLDTNNPTGSFKGDHGETFHLMGQSVYNTAGRNWDATTMVYQNPDSGVTFSVVYDTKSGMILSYNLDYPNEKIYSTLQQTNAEV